MPQVQTSRSLLSWSLLVVLSITWGTSFILIKKGLQAFDPLQLASLRMAVASVAFLPLYLSLRRKIDWSHWRAYLAVGLSGNFIPSFLYAIAQTRLNSSLAGVLNALTPLMTLLVGYVVFKSAFGASKISGVLIGLAGAVLLIWFGRENGTVTNAWFALLIVVGTICYGISSNTVGRNLTGVDAISIGTAAFTILLIPSLIALVVTGVPDVVVTYPFGWQAFGLIALLALASTVVASLLFYKLVHMTNPIFASSVSYLIPVVALFWGIADGEPVTLLSLFGFSLILAGVYLVRR